MLAVVFVAVSCRTGSTSTVVVVAGTGPKGSAGDGGPAVRAELAGPVDVGVDASGRLFIAEVDGRRVRAVSPTGTIATVAEGSTADGEAMTPWGVATGRSGVYVSDTSNHRVWRLSSSRLEAAAGTGEAGFSGDGGPAVAARLNDPRDIEVDELGNVYIADSGNRRVRKVMPDGEITTIAGTGQPGGFGNFRPALEASVEPRGLAVGADGTVYIAETHQNRVRAVRPDGIIVPVAGTGEPGLGGDGDPATEALFNGPVDVAVDPSGTIYIADTGNGRIRRIRDGVVTAVAGGETHAPVPTMRAFLAPLGLVAPGPGELFFADADDFPLRAHHRVGRLRDRSGSSG